jgi:hypothetical protein
VLKHSVALNLTESRGTAQCKFIHLWMSPLLSNVPKSHSRAPKRWYTVLELLWIRLDTVRCVMTGFESGRSTNVETNATTRSFSFVQDRIIATAERKKGDLKSKENEYDTSAGARCGKRKEGTDLCLGPPTDGGNEWKASAANLAGATQPLGRRTIFLGHGQFVPIESPFLPPFPSVQKMSHSCRYFDRCIMSC